MGSAESVSGLFELEQMEFYAYHGCFKEEQVVGNKFIVYISFQADCTVPAKSDNIGDTVNYVSIYEITREQMTIKSHLIEHVAGRIIDEIKKAFPTIVNLTVKISKMNPPMGGQMKCVSVTLKG